MALNNNLGRVVNDSFRRATYRATEDKDQGLIYKATIELSKRYLIIDGRDMAFESGMQVTDDQAASRKPSGRLTILLHGLPGFIRPEGLQSLGFLL